MANRDLEINVRYSPDDGSLVTEQTGANPTTGNQAQNANLTKSFVTLSLLYSTANRVASTGIGQIGEITGNRPLQRKVENASRLVGYGFALSFNPAFAIASIATDVGIEAFQREVRTKNENIQAQYYNKLFNSKYNNSRR
jgi:hypothetical protein